MSKGRILVVDDELDNRVMMRYFLESWGYEVELGCNGQEGLEKVAANRPDLILLDLEMPVMNGFDACDHLKSSPETEQIPVVMFTGLEQTTDKVKGIRKGADDYVVKTVDPEELQARIEMILRRTQRYPAQDAAAAPVNDNAVSGSLTEMEFPEAMQLILTYGKPGVMRLVDGSKKASVFVGDGQQVVHAEADGLEGEEAFYKLIFWKSGRFHFLVGEMAPRHTITASGTNLLIESTRRLDEWNLFSSRIPSFEVTPHRVPLAEGSSIRLRRGDWRILGLANGKTSIAQMSERLRMDRFETARVVYGLLTLGALSLEPEPEKKEDFFDVIPRLANELSDDEPLHLTALQWKVLSYIDGRRSISAVANRAGLPTVTVAEMIKDMAGLGWVELDQKDSQLAVDQMQSADPQPSVQLHAEDVEEFLPRIRAMRMD